jgi:hypothetical protein
VYSITLANFQLQCVFWSQEWNKIALQNRTCKLDNASTANFKLQCVFWSPEWNKIERVNDPSIKTIDVESRLFSVQSYKTFTIVIYEKYSTS